MMIELGAEEIRVLGCLIEKEMTTPDSYPLSTNGLVNACNQSTNREPVVAFSERQVDQAMLTLREAGLARTLRGDGQRVHKHKHVAADVWRVSPAELALLSVLFLRGAQTASELRARTERHGVGLEPVDVERHLRGLAARDEPLVRQLERRPGEREPRWIHLLGGESLARAQSAAPHSDDRAPRVASRESDAAELRARLDDHARRLDELTRRFDALLHRLGEPLD